MTASSDGPPVAPPAVEQKHAINFEWLITLRWVVIIGQIAIIAAVDRFMGIALPLLPMAGIVALEALSNVGGVLWRRRATEIGEAALGLLMLIDVALLTALLYVSGGPFNPFSVLYLVNIALAAVVMSPLWTWTLVVLSLACFGTLFLGHLPLAGEHHGAHEPRISMHLQGMWIAFGVAAAFIVYFIERVTRALAARDAELAAARSLSARHERRDLELAWPRTVFSLSHVALPFPPDDPLYGYEVAGPSNHVQLGNIAIRGENGVLTVPMWALTRQRSNPFHSYVLERIDAFVAGASAR